MYWQDDGRFEDVAAAVALADEMPRRVGDFDGDGHVDLYVGLSTGRVEVTSMSARGHGAARATRELRIMAP